MTLCSHSKPENKFKALKIIPRLVDRVLNEIPSPAVEVLFWDGRLENT
jgi:hypothetical protein